MSILNTNAQLKGISKSVKGWFTLPEEKWHELGFAQSEIVDYKSALRTSCRALLKRTKHALPL